MLKLLIRFAISEKWYVAHLKIDTDTDQFEFNFYGTVSSECSLEIPEALDRGNDKCRMFDFFSK